MTRHADILSGPTPSPWDEARAVAEIALVLLGFCLLTGSLLPGCSCPTEGVLGLLMVWTPSLILFGELAIRANRRARHRSAVLAQERRRIMGSAFDEASPRSEPRACDRSPSTFPWP